MEDNQIKDLFSNFDPELSSGPLFISRLRHRLDAVELVRERIAAERRRSRRAILIAAISGIVAGMLMTLMFPVICSWLISLAHKIPCIHLRDAAGQIITLMLATAISVTIAVNAYDITLSLNRR